MIPDEILKLWGRYIVLTQCTVRGVLKIFLNKNKNPKNSTMMFMGVIFFVCESPFGAVKMLWFLNLEVLFDIRLNLIGNLGKEGRVKSSKKCPVYF